MKRLTERLVLVAVMICFLAAAAGCYASGGYAGYGYGYNNYYDDPFYSAPIDRYGYGFYGHP